MVCVDQIVDKIGDTESPSWTRQMNTNSECGMTDAHHQTQTGPGLSLSGTHLSREGFVQLCMNHIGVDCFVQVSPMLWCC
jgi:hypothetical protein